MTKRLMLLALLAACSEPDKSSPTERRDIASSENMGALWPEAHLSTEGEGSRTLVVGAPRCNIAILYALYGDGVREYLKHYSFTRFRCARGDAEMSAPWK